MPNREIRLDADSGLDDDRVKVLLELAQTLYDAVPLTSIELKQDTPGDPTLYNYELVAADGRTWSQMIQFPAAVDVDPPMTFDVPQGWRRSAEFQHARGLRNHIIDMINNAGLARLEITWS